MHDATYFKKGRKLDRQKCQFLVYFFSDLTLSAIVLQNNFYVILCNTIVHQILNVFCGAQLCSTFPKAKLCQNIAKLTNFSHFNEKCPRVKKTSL